MKNKAQVWIGVVLTLLILGACQYGAQNETYIED